MASIKGILFNRTLEVALIAWFMAQSLKVIHSLLKERRLNFRRFVGAGGMPSSHSSLTMSLATHIGLNNGWDSPLAALSLVFALVVMYDAAGVRYAAGRQAAVLNKIMDELSTSGQIQERRLKELLGHTPVEVFAGAVLGILVAVWLNG